MSIAAKLPKVKLRHSLLPHINFWSVKKQISKSDALPEPNTKAKVPGVCFSSGAPPADGWGLRIGVFSRKFRESWKSGHKSSAFWRELPSKPCKNLPNQQPFVLGRGCRDASCMFTRPWRSYPWWFCVIWQVMNFHKRSCCSTCVPRKINMELAKDSRKKKYSWRMAVSG